MKNKFKKLLSIIMVVIMTACALPMKEFRMDASALTWDEYWNKVQVFINDSRWANGASYSKYQQPKMSGAGSGQGCNAYVRDFVKYVYNVGWKALDGNGFTNPSEIRSGDILYVTPMHWIVVLKRDGNTLYTAEGSWNGVARVTSSGYTINGSTFSGSGKTFSQGIHYLDASESSYAKPNAPTVTLDKNVMKVDDTVYLTWNSCSGATSYNVDLWDDKGNHLDTRYRNLECNDALYILYAGTYHIYVTAINSRGGSTSGPYTIKVYDKNPDMPSFTVSHTRVQPGTTVTASWNPCNNAETYHINVWKRHNIHIKTIDVGKGLQTSYTFTETGDYFYCLTAINPYGSTTTKLTHILVTDEPVGEIKITAKDSSVIIDNDNKFIKNVLEDITSLDNYIAIIDGLTVSYVETANGFGTGTKVEVMNGTSVADTYSIVVPYDVTGDGYCDAFDVSLLSAIANYETEFEESSAYFFAGDIVQDGFIDVFDLSQLTEKANYEI